jgi:hypothetical protein
MTEQHAVSVKRLLPYALVATFAVAVAPLLLTAAAEDRFGLSLWQTIPLGACLSLLASLGGAALWKKYLGSLDVVFADLLLWGFFKRMLVERRLSRATRLIGESGKGWGGEGKLTSAEQAEVLQKLASDLESTDPYTHGHTKRVTKHAFMTAKAMGLAPEMVENIRAAASVHDVGKLFTPMEVLRKPGKLTDEEFETMKEHPVRGAELVEAMGSAEIIAMVRHHHERLDGRGYPDRLSGEDIPLGARVIAVADTFDAITSTRSYRSAARHRKALEILKKEAGTQLDPAAVAAFMTYYSGRNSFGWWASLTTVPQRLLSALRAWIESAGVNIAQGTAVVATAAIVGGVAPVQAALAPVRGLFTGRSKPTTVASEPVRKTKAFPAAPASFSQPVRKKQSGPQAGRKETKPLKNKGGRDADGSTSGGGQQSGGGSGSGGSGGDGSSGGDTDAGGGTETPGTETPPPSTDPGGGGGGTGSGGTSGDGGVIGDTVDTVGGVVDDTVDTVGGVVDDTTGTVGDVVDGVGGLLGNVGGILKPK